MPSMVRDVSAMLVPGYEGGCGGKGKRMWEGRREGGREWLRKEVQNKYRVLGRRKK
jgi:hypothetical protein